MLVIIGFLLIGLTIGMIYAKKGVNFGGSTKGANVPSDSTSVSDSEGKTYDSKDSDKKTSEEPIQVQTSIDETKNEIQVTTSSGGSKSKLTLHEKEAVSYLELTQEDTGEVKVKLSNGRKAEVKIMPNTASRIALAKLRSQNRTLELKEVGKEDDLNVAYISETNKPTRVLGVFKAKYKLKVDIDAQTGDVVKLDKPWWKFLAKDIEEPEIENMDLQLIKPLQDITIMKNAKVKWDLDEYFLNAESYSISNVENIKSKLKGQRLIIIPDKDYIGTTSIIVTAHKGDKSLESLFNIIVAEDILSIQTTQYPAILGEKVKWKKEIKAKHKIEIKLPQQAEDITLVELDENEEIISEEIVTEELVEIETNIDVDSYEIEYYTPKPYAIEKDISKTRKEITIIGPEDIHYTDIIAFNYLSIEAKAEIVKLYWITENGKEEVEIDRYDLNENGLIDYIEWIVPSLSNETYIIEIIKAEHLDSGRNFISDIYDEVYKLDDIWSETIPSGDYVRVTFEQELDNTKDITVYPRIVSGTPRIEVYEINGAEIIAEFTNINSYQYNKVLLTNLEGTQDTFDLLVLDGSIEFDYIFDPTVVALNSPADNTYTNNPTQIFNCSAIDDLMLANITLYGSWSGGWHANETQDITGTANSTTFTKTLQDGTYVWNCLVYDNESNSDWYTSNYTLTIDTISPTMNITYPENTTYNTDVTQLNYTYIETNPDKCWYSLNGGANIPITCGQNVTGLTSNEGSNIWAVYMNDSIGQENSTSVTFFKDTIAPVITIHSPANTTYDTKTVDLNVSADTTIDTWWYSNNSGATNNTFTPNQTYTWEEGSNTVYVWANDSLGNENSSSLIFTVDTTAPVISFSCDKTSAYAGDVITCSCSATDNVDSGPSVSYTTNPSTSNTGTHTTTCTATDDTGNSATSSISYTVNSRGGYPNYKISLQDLAKGYNRVMSKNWKMNFEIENETHTLNVDDVASTSMQITISSEPQQATLLVGEEKKFEFSGDNYYDLLVTLNSIANNKANITIKSIYEEIPIEEIEKERGEKEKVSYWWIWILLAVIIILIAIKKKKEIQKYIKKKRK